MKRTQNYTGSLRYLHAYPDGLHTLVVGIPCVLGNLRDQDVALLDTAAEWCVLRPDIAEALGYPESTDGPPAQLTTRLGLFTGTLERIQVTFPAVDGGDLAVEATWFVSTDWPGPLVLGWTGCLERFRFALDSSDETFYFGEF